jgi:hypothetical protein
LFFREGYATINETRKEKLKVLITNNKHQYYDSVGELIGREGEDWVVRLAKKGEEITVVIPERDFKPTRD